jgi:hypothetical protein
MRTRAKAMRRKTTLMISTRRTMTSKTKTKRRNLLATAT